LVGHSLASTDRPPCAQVCQYVHEPLVGALRCGASQREGADQAQLQQRATVNVASRRTAISAWVCASLSGRRCWLRGLAVPRASYRPPRVPSGLPAYGSNRPQAPPKGFCEHRFPLAGIETRCEPRSTCERDASSPMLLATSMAPAALPVGRSEDVLPAPPTS
jgi:hypothetical protein